MKKDNLISTIRDYIFITIGIILVAFGIQYFYAPNEIAGGGLSGLSLVISHYVPFLSVGTLIFLGNLILFVIAFILVGGDFGMKTIYASFALSFVMDFMEKVMHSHALTGNLLLAVIIRSTLSGVTSFVIKLLIVLKNTFCLPTTEYGENLVVLTEIFDFFTASVKASNASFSPIIY